MNQFYKGRTNNHLTWVMVDATDFATPESAVSAATTIKIYGKLRGATGVNFVSSGAGSLTNDIQHVGASATGIYTIALAKADLSDASAAWYDQYIITLSATGCARQTLVVDGGIDASALSSYQSRLSDILSQLTVVQSMASDAHSAAILAASTASEAQSNILLVQSRLSDLDSRLVSDVSDIRSMLTALSDAISDAHSDIKSGVALTASDMSDLRSAIAAGPAATITASDISDIASAVWANTIGARVDSRVLLNQSRISDVQSYLGGLSATISDIYSLASNINSATLVAADTSDFASAVAVELASDLSDLLSRTTQINSRVLVVQSTASDAHSAAVVTQSQASDIYSLLSDLHSDVGVMSGVVSDIYSAVIAPGASALSDIASAVWARTGADPTTVVAAAGTMGAKLDWLTALSRNKITQNSAVQSLRNDADSADIASAAVSDDGTTFTRGEFA